MELIERVERRVPLPELLAAFNEPSTSDYLVVYLRLLTSGCLQRHRRFFEQFLEGGRSIKEFCQQVRASRGPRASSRHLHLASLGPCTISCVTSCSFAWRCMDLRSLTRASHGFHVAPMPPSSTLTQLRSVLTGSPVAFAWCLAALCKLAQPQTALARSRTSLAWVLRHVAAPLHSFTWPSRGITQPCMASHGLILPLHRSRTTSQHPHAASWGPCMVLHNLTLPSHGFAQFLMAQLHTATTGPCAALPQVCPCLARPRAAVAQPCTATARPCTALHSLQSPLQQLCTAVRHLAWPPIIHARPLHSFAQLHAALARLCHPWVDSQVPLHTPNALSCPLTQPPDSLFPLQEVEPMCKESDHIHIIALARALHVSILVEYMDRGEGGATNPHVFPEGSQPRVCLLYRPGHYDILYK